MYVRLSYLYNFADFKTNLFYHITICCLYELIEWKRRIWDFINNIRQRDGLTQVMIK